MFDKIFGSYNNRILTKNHIKTERPKKKIGKILK
jgi:hypothetical protein